jgi:hypothetical protein
MCYDAQSHERRISSCKFRGFRSGAVAGFSSGMSHLFTGCSLPCVLRPYNGLIFKNQALSDECLVTSDKISDSSVILIYPRVTQVTSMYCAW